MELDVLVYNVEYGGDETTDDVIRKIDADIVGVLESYNRLPAIARATGYPYFNVGLQILSKYPIHEPSGADGLYSLIEVQPGYAVAFFNTHLDYVQYGPNVYLDGMPLDQLIESEEEVRTASMRILIPDMERLATEGVPVFLTGDFNTPSHEDYTEPTVGTREGFDEPIPWPTTQALVDAGLYDTYREIHPDPVAVPGITKDNFHEVGRRSHRLRVRGRPRHDAGLPTRGRARRARRRPGLQALDLGSSGSVVDLSSRLRSPCPRRCR